FRPCHWNFRRPWLRPHGRITDSELVEQRVGVGPREAFDQVSIRRGAGEVRLTLEILCLDDERIALPMAARFSLPLWNVSVRAPIQWHDAGVVDHLREKHDVVGILE